MTTKTDRKRDEGLKRGTEGGCHRAQRLVPAYRLPRGALEGQNQERGHSEGKKKFLDKVAGIKSTNVAQLVTRSVLPHYEKDTRKGPSWLEVGETLKFPAAAEREYDGVLNSNPFAADFRGGESGLGKIIRKEPTCFFYHTPGEVAVQKPLLEELYYEKTGEREPTSSLLKKKPPKNGLRLCGKDGAARLSEMKTAQKRRTPTRHYWPAFRLLVTKRLAGSFEETFRIL